MKNTIITFSGARYHDTTKRTVEDAAQFGASNVLVYDDVWLKAQATYMADTDYFWKHPGHRGCGWFCFKPYVILDALNRAGDDDVIFFIDGDTFPVAHLDTLFNITRRDQAMLFMANGWPRQAAWCKRECFVTMGQDQPKYHDAHHGVARFMGYTRRMIPFVTTWYTYCLDKSCNTFDLDPAFEQLPGFREHRCEQAIMTNLGHKNGFKFHREADEFGDTTDGDGLTDSLRDRDLYPRLFTQIYGNSYAPGVMPGDQSGGSIYRNV